MLRQRVLTAVVLVAVVLWLLFAASQQVWQWAFLGVAVHSAWEWAAFAKRDRLPERIAFMIVVFAVSYSLVQAWNTDWRDDYFTAAIPLLTSIPLLLAIVVWVSRYQKKKGQEAVLTHPGVILLLGVWMIALFTYAMVLLRATLSPSEILLSMLAVWAIDTGAYFTGRRFGKTKLAVHVSPGKTWEGVIGGGLLAFAVLLLGSLIGIQQGTLSIGLFTVIGTLIALLSVYGDLFQSVLKRQVGLKDSGHILPGHGGILDRIDSLLIAMPLFALLWLGSMLK
ncbi:phosphatidate cytidylyltransferase [Galenea microaerophila]